MNASIFDKIENLKALCLEKFSASLAQVKDGITTSEEQIGHLMEELMDFGDDERFVSIYKELRMAVYKQYPNLVYAYDQMFDELWNKELETIKIKVNIELLWEAREILQKQGIPIALATAMFIKETVARGELPFTYTKEDIDEAKRLTGEKE